jgi:hypothetical protein
MGLEAALTDPKVLTEILSKEFPQFGMQLAARATDARWKNFEQPMWAYFQDRYGAPEPEEPPAA